jgi:hypothetical protein
MAQRWENQAMGALCRALDGRDVARLADHLDDASVLHVPGFSGLGGDYQGREAIVGLIHRMAAATDGTLHFEVRGSITSRPGFLHVQGRLSGTRNGHLFSAHLSMDGSLASQVFRSIEIRCSEPSALDPLWGRAQDGSVR